MSTPDTAQSVLGPEEFAAAWVQFLDAAPAQWWMCAERFDDWPFEHAAVSQALLAWSRRHTQGEARLFARDFGAVERSGARFMEWRRLFAHQVQARRWPQRLPDAEGLPRGLWQPRAALQLSAAARPGLLQARVVNEVRTIAVALEELGDAWGQGHAALPAHTLGL